MNLNPLKKDDNTDALVKALEDANASDAAPATGNPTDASTQVAAVPPAPGQDPATVATPPADTEASIIAADPQVISGDNPLLTTDAPAPTDDTSATDTATSTPAATEPAAPADDLPAGLSSDADAHLPQASEGRGDDGELDEVKKEALEALRPLIDKLDLSSADKFDKYLMMLRASDDPTLIKPAYEAAAQIEGEKEKAQALLDVINEINYITANK